MDVEVREYYRQGGERSRLRDHPGGRLEFLRTWDVLVRVLPPPPARVLDVGGAFGIYAGPLADAGYTVHVVDPVAEHVAAAGLLPGVTATVGDVRSLDEADASADAVLLLGPLYHLTSRADRVRAWAEAARVLRPGGVAVGATISRFASLHDGFVKGYHVDPRFLGVVRAALGDGVHRNPDDGERRWFTTAYFHHPDEIPGEVADGGLVVERLVAVEGAAWMWGHLGDLLDDAVRRDLLLDLLRTVEAEPSLLGASSHLLTVARA